MRAAAIVVGLAAACGGTKGHVGGVAVWDRGPNEGTPITLPFAAGTNGTELVVQALHKARAAGATGVSRFEIQIGKCVRQVIAGADLTAQSAPWPAIDRITLRVRETRYRCTTVLEQQLVPDEKNPEGPLHDSTVAPRDECGHEPVEHVVTRYRFEVDASFTPPDWAMLRAWTGLDLRFEAPRCAEAVARNEVRMVVHTDGRGTIEAPAAPSSDEPAAQRAAKIVELVARAGVALPAENAHQALAVWGDGAFIEELDDATAAALAEAIAKAHFFATWDDAAALLGLATPPQGIDAAWAAEIGQRIDALAARFERIGDLVRVDATAQVLRDGAGVLAAIHRHVADLLDAARMPNAATAERDKAAALDAIARSAGASP